MAASPALSSPFLPSSSPLPPFSHSNPTTPLPFSLSPSSFPLRRSLRPLAVSSSSSSSSSGVDDKKQQLMLDRYGLDPSDLAAPQPSQSSRRRREEDRVGKGKRRAVLPPPPPEEKRPPRTTHKLLQVLGGKAHRKKLLSPRGMDVRPMMEVVKGAAFDILQVAGGCPASLRPGRWLDLYSGTGAVGIEALSRGCSEAHFVEIDPWVVSDVLRPNLEWTGFVDVSVIHTMRVESFLEQAAQSLGKGMQFDYISVTPPYTAVDYLILMEQLGKSPLVGEDCFILVEYPLKTSMLDSCGHLIKIADRRFGRTHLLVYGPTWAQKKRNSGRFS